MFRFEMGSLKISSTEELFMFDDINFSHAKQYPAIIVKRTKIQILFRSHKSLTRFFWGISPHSALWDEEMCSIQLWQVRCVLPFFYFFYYIFFFLIQQQQWWTHRKVTLPWRDRGPGTEGQDTGEKKGKSFIFSHSSGWAEQEEKDMPPPHTTPTHHPPLSISPLCSPADSSTVPSEMRIRELTVPASAFPCFASQLPISWIRSHFLSLQLPSCPLLSPLTSSHQKKKKKSRLSFHLI